MAIELKDIPALFDYLGLDATKINSVDDFKTNHDTAFIPMASAENNPDVIKRVSGKIIGSLQTKMGQHFKSRGIEFKPEEIKDKILEDIVDLGLNKMTELSTKALTEMEGKLGKPSEQLAELQGKYGELEKKLKDKDTAILNVQTEFDGFKTQVFTEKKQGKVKQYKESAWGDFKWANGLNELMKEGFQSSIEKKYQVHLDENEEPYVTDIKGERVKSTKKSGDFKSLNEVLEEEGMAAKVYAAASNKPNTPPPFKPQQQQQAAAPGTPEPFVHPRAARAAGG